MCEKNLSVEWEENTSVLNTIVTGWGGAADSQER